MKDPEQITQQLAERQQPDVNGWLEDELYQQYHHDRQAVDSSWTEFFDGNGHTAVAEHPSEQTAQAPAPRTGPSAVAPALPISAGDQLVPLRGPALRIAENMTASLAIPVATSQRAMPVKVMDENRRLINQHRSREPVKAKSLIRTWWRGPSCARSKKFRRINQAYSETGEGSFRVTRNHVNLGLAVDVEGKEGARSLKGSVGQERAGDELRAVPGSLSTTW